MPDANLLVELSFEGVGYPSFVVEWPDVTFPTGNRVGISRPVVDGHGHGIGSRSIAPGTTMPWVAISRYPVGRADCKIDLEARWKAPATAGRREVGIIPRFHDYDNYLVVRLRSMGSGNPELRIFKRVAGVETQVGSTYTGTGIGASDLFDGVKFRVRVVDGPAGAEVKVYTGAITPASNGDLRMTQTVDETLLRGDGDVGIELRDQTFNDDIAISSLKVYDLADEWTSSVEPDASAPWQVEIGSTLHTLAELEALSPPISFVSLEHGYKMGTARATLQVKGTSIPSTLLYPNRLVRVYYAGKLRFRGLVAEASIDGKARTQLFPCRGFEWAATKVILEEDDRTGTHYFNVYATNVGTDVCAAANEDNVPDNYDPTRQNMTIGDIIKWLFDRYLDREAGLRYYNACALQDLPYVTSELALLTGIYPDLALSGNFYTAIQTLIKLQPNFQVYLDPATQIWHFRKVTDLVAEDIDITHERERVFYSANPDPDKSFTYCIARGTKKSEKEREELSLLNGDIAPTWTAMQEEHADSDKQYIGAISLTIVSAGTLSDFVYEGKRYVQIDYVDISAAESAEKDVDPDDFRGGVTTLGGFNRFIIGHTATRFYLSAPAWAAPPAPGERLGISLLDECAAKALSAQGVGRGYVLLRPASICGIVDDRFGSQAYRQSMKNKGFCGKVSIVGKGPDGKEYMQGYEYRAHFLSMEAQTAFGTCGPIIMLSQQPTLPIGLVNHLPPASTMSPPDIPASACTAPGTTGLGNKTPQFDVRVTLSEYEDEAAYLREPEIGFHGPAYSEDAANWDGGGLPDYENGDWGHENPYVLDDSEFKDVTLQGPGIRAAFQAILEQFGEKAYGMQVEMATPWVGRSIRTTWKVDLDRFFDMNKRLTLSSTVRGTGFAASDGKNMPVYKVVYDIRNAKTTLYAGTSNFWGETDPQAFIRMHVDRNLLKKVSAMAAEMRAFKEALLAHRENLVGALPATIPGCSVTYVNSTTRKVSNIQKTVEGKDLKVHQLSLADKLSNELMRGVQADFPGAPIEVPGMQGSATQMPIRSAAVLESAARHDVLDMGPVSNPRINANRGKYGGLTGIDSDEGGKPPIVLLRAGGYAFRTAADANGDYYGGATIEFAPLDAHGEPTTDWTTWAGPTSMPDAHVPLKTITAGALLDTILKRVADVEKRLGTRVDKVTERAIAQGETDSEETLYPDGAPADLLSSLAVFSGMQGMRLLNHTLGDPGGPVFYGPTSDDGADAQMYWRAIMPERIAIQVEDVGYGAGTNGGAWAPKASGNGDSVVFLSSARIIHKQVHAAELDSDGSCAECVTHNVPDDSDFGFATARGVALHATGQSGAGAIIPLPVGATGVIGVQAFVTEHPDDPLGVGENIAVRAKTQFKGSAWSAVESHATKATVTGDASGENVGVYKQPGGAVPPGLRKPSDLAISIERTPGSGADTASGKRAVLNGLSIDVAVIEGGYLLRIRGERIGCIDDIVHNMPGIIEAVSNLEAIALEFGKVLAEDSEVIDNVDVALNPPIALYEEAGAGDEVLVEIL